MFVPFDEQAEQQRDEYDTYVERVSGATAEQEALERAETALDTADRRADQREQVVDRLGDFETFIQTNTEEIERLESELSDVPSGTTAEKDVVGESAVKKLPRVILKLGPAPAD